VAQNGRRRPPRPRIEFVTQPASDEEAEAIVIALERFLAEAAPAPAQPHAVRSRWQRAALREGIGARDVSGYDWGAPSS
jgi:hypothetical protein